LATNCRESAQTVEQASRLLILAAKQARRLFYEGNAVTDPTFRRIVPALLALLTAVPTLRATDDDISYPVEDFALTERSGRPMTKDDLLGKVWIASFVLVRCPDGKCPQVTQTMQLLQAELKNRKDVLLVTFTIDPDGDTPGELKRYADAYDADPDKWLFLTGSEDTIDALMRSMYIRAGEGAKKAKEHALRLVVVDKQGNMRGSYLGMKPTTGDSAADDEIFDNEMKRLRRQVNALTASEFPAFNATLNAISGGLLVLGYLCIRRRLVRVHATLMLSALAVSTVFLASYLYFHLVIKRGVETRFADQAPDAPAWVGTLYYTILISHIILAIATVPLALGSAYLGLRGRILGHVRLAKWTFPIWLYVSVTGIVVYWMLYRLYPGT
jgi:protein SCO1